MGRATEFIDYINNPKPQKSLYSHLNISSSTEQARKDYRKTVAKSQLDTLFGN